MEYFSLAFSVVFPLFFMMAIGYTLKIIKIFNESFLKQLNSLCFKVFLPILVFFNIYKSDFKTYFPTNLVIFAVIAVVVLFLILMLIVPILSKENKNRGVIIQGIFRSNFVLFGLPMAASIYPDETPVATTILIAFAVPLFNFFSVIALEFYSGKQIHIPSIALKIIQNPLIIASVVGMIFVVSGIKFPSLIEISISSVASITTPLALIVLGGSFNFASLGKYKLPLSMSVLSKLVLFPLIFLSVAVMLGFRNAELVALLGMFASPTAVSSFAMAQSVNANHELAGQIVVMDSIFSVFTIFIWVSALMSLQFI